MNHYRVLVLAVNGKRGIYRSGDEVNEDNFPPGHAELLAERGFLERVGNDEIVPADETGQPEVIVKEKFDINEVTMTQMKADLKLLNVEYPKNASKVELFDLWKGIKK